MSVTLTDATQNIPKSSFRSVPLNLTFSKYPFNTIEINLIKLKCHVSGNTECNLFQLLKQNVTEI